MQAYNSCYGGPCCTCVRCRMRRQAELERQKAAVIAAYTSRLLHATPDRLVVQPTDPLRDALIDIAHDCGTLEAAQRRAKEALKQMPDKWDTHEPNTRNRY